MAFKDVPGNTRVKRILKLALERGRVPNSLIFGGPPGAGKTDMALTLAKALNCQALADDSCDDCPSCRAVDNGRHPDVVVLAAEVRDVKIEQTRFLKQMAYLRPMTGRRRVFVIREAESLNDPSANSLLKVLEEPPSFCHIILVTDSPHRLLPTIRSRCRTLAFSAIGREEIEERLLARAFSREQARLLALLSRGDFDRAQEFEWEKVQELRDNAWTLFEALGSAERPGLFLERFGSVPKAAEEEFGEVLEVFSSFARDILLLRLGGDPALLLNPDYEGRLRAAAAAWAAPRAVAVVEELDRTLADLRGNLNKGLLALTFFSNVTELAHV
ncbi:MAG TPA: DNA polymerase III subunit delta' [Candidatus Aminicenantes bacterium]|nr:DNA polymerase III subunit delta' [Candidatus Aminicenantes bacterium]